MSLDWLDSKDLRLDPRVPAQVTTTSRIKLRGLRLSWMHSKPNQTLPRIMKFRRGSATCLAAGH